MKYLTVTLLMLFLVSCDSNQDYKELLNFKQVDYSGSNGVYCGETKELQVGDSIIVYGGTNNFLIEHFNCDTCQGKIESIYFSKPTGLIAFINFNNNPSKVVVYSISLYYWDSTKGYNVSTFEGWENKMTDKELDVLNSDFIRSVKSYRVDNNVFFQVLN